jgi:hypothetical protein
MCSRCRTTRKPRLPERGLLCAWARQPGTSYFYAGFRDKGFQYKGFCLENFFAKGLDVEFES